MHVGPLPGSASDDLADRLRQAGIDVELDPRRQALRDARAPGDDGREGAPGSGLKPGSARIDPGRPAAGDGTRGGGVDPRLGASDPLGTTGADAVPIRPDDDPLIPSDPPVYADPVDYVPPTVTAGSTTIIVEHPSVTIYAGDVDLVCHDPWPSFHGWHHWIHPHQVHGFVPVHHGWSHGWSWSISFGVGGSFGHRRYGDWWFGWHGASRCFPYVPYVAARRSWGHWPGYHAGWWHVDASPAYRWHRPAYHWHRPHLVWHRDVCLPRTETVYVTVERAVPPPPPTRAEAWDAFALGRIGRAADLFELILDARPGDAEARLGLALARARLGDVVLAAADVRRALETWPDALEVVPAGPGIEAELGIARSRLRDRLRVDPADVDALLMLAVVLERLADPAAAYHAVDRAIGLGEVSAAAVDLRDRLDQRLLFGP